MSISKKRSVEAPERMIYVLLLATVVVSIFGTFFVLRSADRMVQDNGVQQQVASVVDYSALKTTGFVAVEVLPQPKTNETVKTDDNKKGLTAVSGTVGGE